MAVIGVENLTVHDRKRGMCGKEDQLGSHSSYWGPSRRSAERRTEHVGEVLYLRSPFMMRISSHSK